MDISAFRANRPRRAGIAVVAISALTLAASAAFAQPVPEGEPVRWDQARVTKIAQELAVAVHDAREAVRMSPLDQNVGQRTTFYELQEDIRLAENSARHLAGELESGKDAAQTRATFDRIGSLRLSAEENGRRVLIEAPVMDALFKAGELHNRLKPYYYGKR